MTQKHIERKPGHVYVLLAKRDDITTEHVEQFIETEDSQGRGVGTPRGLTEGEYRLLEFPDPAVHAELLEALEFCRDNTTNVMVREAARAALHSVRHHAPSQKEPAK